MYKILNIILVSFLLLSCNKATIDLNGFESNGGELVGKWELSGFDIERITDNLEISDEEFDEGMADQATEPGGMFLDFFADGRVITTLVYVDEDGTEQKWGFEGRYTLSADKETLTIKDEEDETTILEILSLTPTTFSYRSRDSIELEAELTVEQPGGGAHEYKVVKEEFWSIWTFKKIQ